MTRSPLDPDVLSRIAGLSLRVRRVVEGGLSGAHRSRRHGSSIEFAEHRKYSWGDDLKHVDWKAYGRTDRYYLKQFEDETRFAAHILLDASGSMAYRHRQAPWSKFEAAQCLAGALAWLVVMQGDAVGMWAGGEGDAVPLPAVAGREQLRRVIEFLEPLQPAGRIEPHWWRGMAERFPQRSLVVAVSDLMDEEGEAISGLQRLRHAGHDVILFHVLDPAELSFPFARTTRFVALEGAARVVTEPRAVRRAYLEEIERFLERVESACRGSGIDYQRMVTNESLGKVLAAFLAWRRTRMAW